MNDLNDKSQSEIIKLKEENEKLEKQLTNMFNIMTLTNELTLSLEMDEVYRNILDILIVSIGSKRHSIALLDKAGRLKIVASKFGDDDVDYEHVILEKGVGKQVLETNEIYTSKNVHEKNPDDIIGCIPLIAEDKTIGLLIIHELLSHKKEFTEEDIELFNLLSTQAGYALSAAQAYQLTKKEIKTKDNEITKLFDVSNLVNSAVDINEVLKITLDTMCDMIICDISAIFLYSEECNALILRQSMGFDPSLLNSYQIAPGEGISGKAFKEKRPILIKNIDKEVRYINLVTTQEAQHYSGSVLSVPIMVKDKAIGVLTICKYKDEKPLDVPEKKILTTLAAQTAIGIDNACLYEKQGKELVRVSSLFIATNQLHSTMDIDEIYRIADELLVDFIGADKFFISIKDSSEENLIIVLSKGIDNDIAKKVKIPIEKGIIGNSIISGKSFIVSPNTTPPIISIGELNLNLFACIPLRLGNKIMGAIVINDLLPNKNSFATFDRELFDLMAHNTGTAILRAQLFAKSEQKSYSKYDLSRLLTMEYDLENSVKSAIRLIHTNVFGIKSAVLIRDTKQNKYTPIANEGYSLDDLNTIPKPEGPKIVKIKLFAGSIEIGFLFIERIHGNKFNEKELDIFKIAGHILSEFVSHDKSFKLSKNLALLLNREKSQSDAIVKGVADGLIVTDLKNNIMLINPAIEKIFHIKEKEAVGANFNTVIRHKKIQAIIGDTLDKGFIEKNVQLNEINKFLAVKVKSSLVKDDKGTPVGLVTIFHDVTKEKEAEKIKNEFLKKLQKVSITDPLTGTYNRRYFEKRINEEFNKSKRYNTNFSCIMIDADNFKSVNDTHGHEVGDEVLVRISHTIQKSIRDVDILSRYGGEEFVLILPEANSENAIMVSERLRKAIAKEIFHSPDNKPFSVTISLGISSYQMKGIESPSDLVRLADNALYQAKKQGRNKAVLYTSREEKNE